MLPLNCKFCLRCCGFPTIDRCHRAHRHRAPQPPAQKQRQRKRLGPRSSVMGLFSVILIILGSQLAGDTFVTGSLHNSAYAEEASRRQFRPEPEIRSTARRILSDPVFQRFDHFDQDVTRPPVFSENTPVLRSEKATASRKSPAGDFSKPSPHKSVREPDRDSSSQTQHPADATQPDNDRSAREQDQPRSESGRDIIERQSGARLPDSNTSPSSEPRQPPSHDANSHGTSNPVEGHSTEKDHPQRTNSSQPGDTEAGESTAEDAASSPRNLPTRSRWSSPDDNATTTSRGMPSLRGSDGIQRPVRFAPKSETVPERAWWEDWFKSPEMSTTGLGNMGGLLGQIMLAIAYAAVAVVVVLILVLVARGVHELLGSRTPQARLSPATAVPLADDRSPGETPADIYLQRALDLARAGAYRAATGQLILGAMSAIERAQWIRYRRGLTLHDYLRAVRSRPLTSQGLRSVVQIFEPIEYGRQIATSKHFETALAGYQLGFQQPAVSTQPSTITAEPSGSSPSSDTSSP